MKKCSNLSAYYLGLVLIILSSCTPKKQYPPINTYLNVQIDYSSFPSFSEWMYYKNNYADWLGQKYFNRYLREPINIVIIDEFSNTTELAIEKLLKECKSVGYADEYGHTSGYQAMIGNQEYSQIPNNKHMAFSNKDFFMTNNHGRIIGPALYNNKYYFVAGFSTEKPTIIKGFKHLFISFNKARNDFAQKLNTSEVYKIVGYINLNNTIDSKTTTTADHDGKAIVFQAMK